MGAHVRPVALPASWTAPRPAARAAARSATGAAALAAAVAITTGGAVACSGSAPSADRVFVSNGGCGASWKLAGPGTALGFGAVMALAAAAALAAGGGLRRVDRQAG